MTDEKRDDEYELDETPWRKVPSIGEDEDGEQWWIEGHDVTDVDAQVALALYLASPNGPALRREEAYTMATQATVERLWFRLTDEENGRICEASEEGAMPFTRMTCPDECIEAVLL